MEEVNSVCEKSIERFDKLLDFGVRGRELVGFCARNTKILEFRSQNESNN